MTRRPPTAPEPLEPRRLFDSAFPNVNVSRLPGNHAEGTIAIDPTNPSRLFAASNAPGAGVLTASSTDGGATWTTRRRLRVRRPRPARRVLRPQRAFDRFGNLFFTYAHDNGGGVEVVPKHRRRRDARTSAATSAGKSTSPP